MKLPKSRRRRLPRFLACPAIVLLAWLTPQAVCAAPSPEKSLPSQPAFRLESAAAPFGSATVVADFDADGTPDVAIADRIDQPSGSHYGIEVRLSEGTTQSVSFVWVDGALNITAVDIDGDHDVDLVVSPVLSRKIVGVWLNNGAGNFDRRDTSEFPPVAPKIDPASLNGLPNHLDEAAVMPERRTLDILAPVATVPRLEEFAVASLLVVVCVQQAIRSAASPRAPPFLSLLTISR